MTDTPEIPEVVDPEELTPMSRDTQLFMAMLDDLLPMAALAAQHIDLAAVIAEAESFAALGKTGAEDAQFLADMAKPVLAMVELLQANVLVVGASVPLDGDVVVDAAAQLAADTGQAVIVTHDEKQIIDVEVYDVSEAGDGEEENTDG